MDSHVYEFTLINNINSNITINAVSEIQKQLHPYDTISMVFLLYDIPEIALRRLILLQRLTGDIEIKNLNLISTWVMEAQTRSNWKIEFFEVLVLCRLYNFITKLGFHLPTIKKLYKCEKPHLYTNINPMKIALYRLCENINSDNLREIKNSLIRCKIDVAEYEFFELVILELMCQNFITVNQNKYCNKKNQLENLIKIIENIPELNEFSNKIKETEKIMNSKPKSGFLTAISTPETQSDNDEELKTTSENVYPNDFSDLFEIMKQRNEDDFSVNELKTDNSKTLENEFNK